MRLPRALIPRPSAIASPVLGLGFAVLAATTACAAVGATTPSAPPVPSPASDPATPSSMEPAAGICGETEGPVVSIALHPDVPDPRCAVVRPEQVLEIHNGPDARRQVILGPFEVEIPAGESFLLDEAFGRYLAPGVHQVRVQPCCGPELWLKAP